MKELLAAAFLETLLEGGGQVPAYTIFELSKTYGREETYVFVELLLNSKMIEPIDFTVRPALPIRITAAGRELALKSKACTSVEEFEKLFGMTTLGNGIADVIEKYLWRSTLKKPEG